MDSISKVMTVSYGTFSCQLEGFDDPFTTMQLVAEYFRKLAADDRYFGGEPLQPDADTLHRIARDANPNKVDAEVTENSIILRQADVVDAPTPAPAIDAEKDADALPVFKSRRAPRAQPVAERPTDESLVESAQFSSRRGFLEPATQEPAKPAAEMLREEETEEEIIAFRTVGPKVNETPNVEQAVLNIASAASKKLPRTDPQASHIESEAESQQDNDIQNEEEALERLLETTNSKLSTPSHARRSNALERLKAAVAATEAERRLRGGSKTSRPKVQDLAVNPDTFRQEMRAVRSSHEDAIKISRPVLKRGSSSRQRGSIATLVLGSDQQIPAADEALKKKSGADPIIGTVKKPTLEIVQPKQTSGFADFVSKSGASTLHQLLEASAAYLALVEDQPRFSQERLVANLDSYLQDKNLSPEATNRSLNRLLRDGRILRVKADRYTLSKSARHGYQAKMAG